MTTIETASEQTSEDSDLRKEKEQSEMWNMLALSGHHVMLRLAWIFKTETVIMPAFLDVIAGAGWIRGCLPVLNRISQSTVPVIMAPRLRNSPKKTTMLMQTSFLMSALFGVLAYFCTYLGEQELSWFPAVYLTIYAIFFATTGVNQLSFNTLQGKLIRPHRRGRLMSIAGMTGSVVAMIGAYFLLTKWLSEPDGRGFAKIFGFTSLCFFLAAFLIAFVREPQDAKGNADSHPLKLFRNVWQTIQQHESMRRVAVVAFLFICSILLFPHYQWLGREKLGAGPSDLMLWVIIQNLSVGCMSWITGYFGDRYGYRIVIRYEIFAMATIPLIAIGLSEILTPETRGWYTITFWMLGLTPVTIKTMFNYVLELVEEEHHPHYLSTLNICMAVPLFAAPAVGLMIDWNPTIVFSAISLLVLTAAVLTFRMNEPREHSQETG